MYTVEDYLHCIGGVDGQKEWFRLESYDSLEKAIKFVTTTFVPMRLYRIMNGGGIPTLYFLNGKIVRVRDLTAIVIGNYVIEEVVQGIIYAQLDRRKH